MSHGGGSSIIEAIYYGKPLIVSPIAGDQIGSGYRVEKAGYGISLRFDPTEK